MSVFGRKPLSAYFALIVMYFVAQSAGAYAMGTDLAYCYPGTPDNNTTPASFSYNFGTQTITDVNDNAPGTILPSVAWSTGKYQAYCDSTANVDIYFWGVSGLDPSGTTGDPQGSDIFFPLTNELSVSTHVKLYRKKSSLDDKTVPFSSYNTEYSTVRSEPTTWTSGTQGYIKIRLDKKVISNISLSNILLVSLYASQIQDSHGPIPVFNAYISNLTINVPQGCTINEGSSFTVKLPDVWASELSKAGAGMKPTGVSPVATTIPINCTNMDVDAIMTLEFDGNISSTKDASGKQSIIQSQDNADVGVMIMDSEQQSVELHAIGNNVGVPFRLQENEAAESQTANVTFLALPVSTTGHVPAAGKYSALAVLRVEYQ